jgi:hypothetical protein
MYITEEDLHDEHLDQYRDEDDLNWHYEEIITKMENLPEELELSRVVFLTDPTDLNVDKLGIFWTDNKDLYDQHFLDYLQHECAGKTFKGDAYLIKATFQNDAVNKGTCVAQYLLNPNEDEITLFPDVKPQKWDLTLLSVPKNTSLLANLSTFLTTHKNKQTAATPATISQAKVKKSP